MGLSILDKEQLILGTILNCNQEIKKFKQLKSTKLFENLNNYDFSIRNLMGDSLNLEYSKLNESLPQLLNDNNYVKNTRGNYYGYFQKVNEFLNNYEPVITQTLNESLNPVEPNEEYVPIFNIFGYRDELKKIIQEIETQNDANLPKNILRIKVDLNKPIFVLGFNLSNNFALKKELFAKFSVDDSKLLAIAYCKYNKQVLFFQSNLQQLIVYDIAQDILDYWNSVNEDKLKNINLNSSNYIKIFKEETTINDIIELYLNTNQLNLKYTDNLYHDERYKNYVQTFKNNAIGRQLFKS